jgi:hypothetical protein
MLSVARASASGRCLGRNVTSTIQLLSSSIQYGGMGGRLPGGLVGALLLGSVDHRLGAGREQIAETRLCGRNATSVTLIIAQDGIMRRKK